MRILVRNALSGEFLKADGGWTKDVQESRAFEKSYEAIEIASKLNGSALEILLSFGDPAFDINIPLENMPPTQSDGSDAGKYGMRSGRQGFPVSGKGHTQGRVQRT